MAHTVGCNDPVTQCQYCKGILIDEVIVAISRTKKAQYKKIKMEITYGFVDFAKKKINASNCTMCPIIINLHYKKNVIVDLIQSKQRLHHR